MAEYKRLGDYIREVNVRNREHRAMQAYAFEDAFEDGSEMGKILEYTVELIKTIIGCICR